MTQDPRAGAARQGWERQWSQTDDQQFEWSLPGVAPQLRELVETGTVPAGRALDLGCGAGASTSYLAGAFRIGVGLDIAHSALVQARRNRDGSGAVFLVADAVRPPFPDGAFSLVFDRGCLQNLAQADWKRYFDEVARLLVPGGTLALLVSKMVAEFPPALSSRGMKLRWAWYVKNRRSGPQFLSHDFLREVLAPSLRVDTLEDFVFTTKKGKARQFTHGRFTRT